MGFADTYLEKQKDLVSLISADPFGKVRFCIIIPCYNESQILSTLDSIWNCEKPNAATEILILINSSTNTPKNIIDQSKNLHLDINQWIENHQDPDLQIFVTNIENIPEKKAGVGYARKLAMDEAINRFNKNNREDGVIISLDADSICKQNYLVEIEKAFTAKQQTNALTIYFEHPTIGNDFESEIYSAIVQYELYLRYYKQSLEYCGFPYSFYTIGSCFAVSAKAYVKQGGMNSKQAGEDFYFLQKIFSLGNTEELNTTCVYPSPRPSDRVIFGTGATVKYMVENPTQPFLIYNFDAFFNLKDFFQLIDHLYRIDVNELNNFLYQLPLPLADFLAQHDFFKVIQEINRNSSNIKTFKKRFFDWFNAFKIVKYLNYVHEKFYQKQELIGECKKLLNGLKIKEPLKDNSNLIYLDFFRKLEKRF